MCGEVRNAVAVQIGEDRVLGALAAYEARRKSNAGRLSGSG